jgi:DNA-binding CsgD family transcriptional regulator
MISTAMGKLLDRAERVGAALVICDGKDKIIRVNNKHAQIYNFVDFNAQPTFEDFLWSNIHNRKMANKKIYENPQAWLKSSAVYRDTYDYHQFVTHHMDGRVVLVFYEKVNDLEKWSYQIRIDITNEMRARFGWNGVTSEPVHWQGLSTPYFMGSSSGFLETVPAASGLILARGLLLDANRALLTILNDADGLRVVDGRVTVRTWSEQATFSKRLERFFSLTGQRRISLRVSRLDSTEAYFLTVTPLLDRGRETWEGGHVGVLTVANPAAMPAVDPSLLVEFFEITWTEAEVAAALGRGQSTAKIAECRGVQVNTIHAHIKSILRKTGCTGQIDIARRVVDIARVFGS